MPPDEPPIIVAIISDLHAGSTVGLCPPRFTLDDGGDYVSSAAQRWLWRNWNHFWAKVKVTAEEHDALIVSICNGDLVDGNHFRTTQTVTPNETGMMRLASKVLEPIIKLSDEIYIVRGTAVHTGSSGRLEEKIADDITTVVRDEKRASWWYLPLNINGTIFDIAHHGRLGRLPWTTPNAVNSLAGQIIIHYAETGHKPPDVVIRSHLHRYADTGGNFDSIRVVATPAWQLITGYVHRLQPGALADIGGLIFTCFPKGRYEMELVRYRPKRRQPVKVLT